MYVLVVDDSLIMRKIISVALKEYDIEGIIEASNGQEAFAAASRNNQIELILMDWNMPVLSGFDALRKIRANDITIPIIMVTTESEQQRVMEALKAGADDYLVKPFSPNDIHAKLTRFIKGETENA